MTQLIKNLSFLMHKYDISPSALARATGVPQPSIHRIITGISKEPRASNLLPIAEYFGVTTDFLRYGFVEEHYDTYQDFSNEGYTVPTTASTGAKPIPVIDYVRAGQLTDITDPYPAGSGHDVIFTDTPTSRCAFALDIIGESMLPEFLPGDRIIIDPELAPQPGDFVVAKNHEEQATFKKYRPVKIDAAGNTVFELAPLNPDYPTLYSDINSLKVIGVMVEHRRYRKRR